MEFDTRIVQDPGIMCCSACIENHALLVWLVVSNIYIYFLFSPLLGKMIQFH